MEPGNKFGNGPKDAMLANVKRNQNPAPGKY